MDAAEIIAPGARIVARDAEWLVRKSDRTSTGGMAYTVVGISELVRDKEAIFLDEIDTDIEILDPVDTRLVPDTSSFYQASLLYMESLLRQMPPTGDKLYIGYRGAMDYVPYQLEPAIQALQQTRQRLLIADAVGLGKTISCGVLVSELIRRGRGKRILVLAVKSMLTQFQKEMWSRFTIPLVRLDSIGIQRVRSRIPTNHNPFYYYDKAIISIDTLKQDSEYRTYLENAYWDIIVIDEAHNVAERGKSSSQRARLARLLAGRSDTLIMLSATPHDGRARSFASLMNMLDPTAIADPDNYGPEDIKGLFIRRFKKDIQEQVSGAFRERVINKAYCQASVAEEEAFAILADLEFARLDQRQGAGQLFKTTLEKSLFSSPAACLKTIHNRIARLEKNSDGETSADILKLKQLATTVERIIPEQFSRYRKLLALLRDRKHGFAWTGKDRRDRLVIFTERIETLKFLQAHLPTALGLKDKQVAILHGSMSDVDQQKVVEDFGKEEAPIRLLIASDVASEGINLHYLSHRLIHFDIPWSLMVFQQRNGRIDRYGQEETPYILYLVNQSGNEKIRGDLRILELLIKKDEEAVKNIGDPSALMGVYDIDEEEKITAAAIAGGQSVDEFEARLNRQEEFDPLALLLGDTAPATAGQVEDEIKSIPTLYADDYHYCKAAIEYLKQRENLQAECLDSKPRIILPAPEELKRRLRFSLPREVWPADDTFVLSADRQLIQAEIKRSRQDENAWPTVHYLWPLNPVVNWLNDKVVAAFGRHEAPVLVLPDALAAGETVFIISGLIPNRKGHPLVQRWFGVTFNNRQFQRLETFTALLARTGLDKTRFPNRGIQVETTGLRELLPAAVQKAREYLHDERRKFEEIINEQLNRQLADLDRLRDKQYRQLELAFFEKRQLSKKERQKREIDRRFDEFIQWVEETMTTEDHPFIQLIAVLQG